MGDLTLSCMMAVLFWMAGGSQRGVIKALCYTTAALNGLLAIENAIIALPYFIAEHFHG